MYRPLLGTFGNWAKLPSAGIEKTQEDSIREKVLHVQNNGFLLMPNRYKCCPVMCEWPASCLVPNHDENNHLEDREMAGSYSMDGDFFISQGYCCSCWNASNACFREGGWMQISWRLHTSKGCPARRRTAAQPSVATRVQTLCFWGRLQQILWYRIYLHIYSMYRRPNTRVHSGTPLMATSA